MLQSVLQSVSRNHPGPSNGCGRCPLESIPSGYLHLMLRGLDSEDMGLQLQVNITVRQSHQQNKKQKIN